MLRIATAAAAAVLLVLAGFFVWKSRAAADPSATVPKVAAAVSTPETAAPARHRRAFGPPAASDADKEARRFARADKDKDGKIELGEMLLGRRKGFDKLDANHDGVLSFEEYTAKTRQKFNEADGDHSGWLSSAEYAETAPRRKAHAPRCACAA
ncbi:MAG: histidine kinase [Alphaproteobacteria bacterium]|nr:histidine kinase [Alphaproteobacteria bacterium]